MPRAFRAPLIAGLLVMGGAGEIAGQEATPERLSVAEVSRLVEFELEDQFRRTWTQEVVAGQVVVCLVTGRRTGDAARAWGDALATALEAELGRGDAAVLAVAHIRGVPRFLRGIVVGRLPERQDRWVLMDWKGLFAETYGLDTDVATFLFFDQAGALRSSFETTAVTDEQVALVQQRVAELLAEYRP